MTQTTTKISDLLFLRMEATAKAGASIIDRALAEGRPLSNMESAELRLMAIEQPIRRRKWREAVISEGGNVPKSVGDESRGLRVTNATQRQLRTLWLYGEIGGGGISADDLRQELSAIPDSEEIELRIHTDGGSYTDSVAMNSMLSRRAGAVHVVIDGLAASGGSVVAMAGTTITMSQGAWMMIHEAHGTLTGGADELESAAERIRAVNQQLIGIYLPRWKGTQQELAVALAAETWFDAKGAVTMGLADALSDTLAVAARLSPKNKFRNVPSELAIAVRAAEIFPQRLKAELKLHRLYCLSY